MKKGKKKSSDDRKRRMIDLSIVVPAYNEEESVQKAILEIFKTFRKAKINLELILVDDGSTDNTLDICKKLKRKYLFKIIHLKKNKGYSKALHTGFLQAKGKYLTYIDADLQYHPSQILKLYNNVVTQNYDFVIGHCRKKWYRGKGYRIFRRLASKFYNLLIRVLFKIKIKDVHSKRVFRRSLIDFKKMKVYYGLIDFELLYHAVKNKAKIKQVPIEVKPRFAGKSKLNIRLMLMTLLNLFRLRFDKER